MAAPIGNQNARKAKRWEDALNKAMARYTSENVKVGEALDKIAETVVIQALAGSKDAWQEIGNRLDGKAPQALIHTGDDEGGPVKQSIEYHIIEHSPKD